MLSTNNTWRCYMGPLEIFLILLGAFVGTLIGFYIRSTIYERKIAHSKEKAQQIIDEAIKEAENRKRQALLEFKEEQHRIKTETEQELRERRQLVLELEARLNSREESLESRQRSLMKREELISDKEERLDAKLQELKEKEELIEKKIEEQNQKLQEIAQLTMEEAQEIIMERVKKEISH